MALTAMTTVVTGGLDSLAKLMDFVSFLDHSLGDVSYPLEIVGCTSGGVGGVALSKDEDE